MKEAIAHALVPIKPQLTILAAALRFEFPCVPQAVPNSTTLDHTSLALNFTVVTFTEEGACCCSGV